MLKGKTVKIDTFVVPATSEIARGLKTEQIGGKTLEEIFLAAGAKIGEPSCAACLGGPSGHLRPAERADLAASARPTATSPAAWATRRRRCSSPAR